MCNLDQALEQSFRQRKTAVHEMVSMLYRRMRVLWAPAERQAGHLPDYIFGKMSKFKNKEIFKKVKLSL